MPALGNSYVIFYISIAMATPPSISESQLKKFRKLLLKKYRREENLYIIEGSHLVSEALRSSADVKHVLVSHSYTEQEEFSEIGNLAEQKRATVFRGKDDQIRSLSDTVTAQGIVAIIQRRETRLTWNASGTREVRVVLDGVSDPGNVGTIIRTCDWFGVNAVILGEDSTEIENPKVLRASMGSTFHLPVAHEPDLPSLLALAKNNGWTIAVTLPAGGVRPRRDLFAGRCCLILGNEARGISRELIDLADQKLTIPRSGNAESLNVAVTCGIILAEISESP